jgi:hypothetical protein
MTVPPSDIEITVTTGPSEPEGTRLIPCIQHGSEHAYQQLNFATRAVEKLQTDAEICAAHDNEGDQFTLADFLDRNGLSVDDIARERTLENFQPATDLLIGDIVAVQRLVDADPQPTQYGVVTAIHRDPARANRYAELRWEHGGRSRLSDSPKGLKVGHPDVAEHVYSIQTPYPDNVENPAIRSLRAHVRKDLGIKQFAEETSVSVEEQWAWPDRQQEAHKNLGARLTVRGGPLDEPVSVRTRSLHDIGWIAIVEDAPTEEAETLARKAAREKGPLPKPHLAGNW